MKLETGIPICTSTNKQFSADNKKKCVTSCQVGQKKNTWSTNSSPVELKQGQHIPVDYRQNMKWVKEMPILLHGYSKLIHSFIPLACAECDDSLPFSGTSSIPLCHVLFPITILHQQFFHPLSPHLAIYFLVYLSNLLFPDSYIMLFREFYFLPFSVHAQTNVIYLTLLSLL